MISGGTSSGAHLCPLHKVLLYTSIYFTIAQVVSPTDFEEEEEIGAEPTGEGGEEEEQSEDEYEQENDDDFEVTKPNKKNGDKTKTTTKAPRTSSKKQATTTEAGVADIGNSTETVGGIKFNTDCELGPIVFIPIPGLPLPLPVPLPNCKIQPVTDKPADKLDELQYDQEEQEEEYRN